VRTIPGDSAQILGFQFLPGVRDRGVTVILESDTVGTNVPFQAGIAELRVADHHRPRIVEGHPERYTARHFETGQQAADQGLDALRGRLRARSLRVAPQDQPSPAREGES